MEYRKRKLDESYAKLTAALSAPSPPVRQAAHVPTPVERPTIRQASMTHVPTVDGTAIRPNGNAELDWIVLADGSLRSIQKHRVRGVLTHVPPANVVKASASRPFVDFKSTLNAAQLSLINGIPKDVLAHGGGPNSYGADRVGYIAASKSFNVARSNHHLMIPNWGLSTACAPSASAYVAASAAAAPMAAEPPPPSEPQRSEWQMPAIMDDSAMYTPWVKPGGPILTGRDLERDQERDVKRRHFLSNLGPKHPLHGQWVN